MNSFESQLDLVQICPNGELMPSRYDSAFRHMYVEATHKDTGSDEWNHGSYSLISITSAEIAHYAHEFYSDEAKNIDPGWYIVKVNSDGIIWAYNYRGEGTMAEEAARADFAKLEAAYDEWCEVRDEAEQPVTDGICPTCGQPREI